MLHQQNRRTSTITRMADSPIHIAAYNPAWPAMFESEKALLAELLSPWIEGGIEHVGSTAVRGLCAKPVIDIMVGVRSLRDSVPAVGVLRQLIYQHADYRSDIMHWFCKPSAEFRTHHLQLIPYESPVWRERLAFRDLMRRNAQLAEEYAALKLQLATTYQFDREAYTQAKTPFITRALSQLNSPRIG